MFVYMIELFDVVRKNNLNNLVKYKNCLWVPKLKSLGIEIT